VTIEVDEIDLLPFSSITPDDLARTENPTSKRSVDARRTPARSTRHHPLQGGVHVVTSR